MEALTDREKQVHKLLAEGLQTKIIAHKLELSEGTIKVHMRTLFKKLGVNNKTAAALKYQGDIVDIPPPVSYQSRVYAWMIACFGTVITYDRQERNHRFLEEALELVQSLGCTKSEAHQLVDYVYGRPVGDAPQEVGGSLVTLTALCIANGFNLEKLGEVELARIWTKVEQIRAKQAAKPKHSPLPECDHRNYRVNNDGRRCPDCGASMWDAGD